jgi:hypothetical protein
MSKQKTSVNHFLQELVRLQIENDRRIFLACGFDQKVIDSIFPLNHQPD